MNKKSKTLFILGIVMFAASILLSGTYAYKNVDRIYDLLAVSVPTTENTEDSDDKSTSEFVVLVNENESVEIPLADPSGADSSNQMKGLSLIITDKIVQPLSKCSSQVYVRGFSQIHNGIDLTTSTPAVKCLVNAILPGVVKEVDYKQYSGYTIKLDHGNGIESEYQNGVSDSAKVRVGDKVNSGDVLMELGSTGLATAPMLHLSVKENDRYLDPAVLLGIK